MKVKELSQSVTFCYCYKVTNKIVLKGRDRMDSTSIREVEDAKKGLCSYVD